MAQVINIKTKLPVVEVMEEKVVEEVKKSRKKKSTSKLVYKALSNSAKVLGLVAMIAGITSYLIYQNYEFFIAIIKSGHTFHGISVPAILNSVVAELILLTAAAYTVSKKVITKLLAWVLMLGMISGLGVFMHASIDNDLTGNSDYVQSLKQQRKDAIAAKEGYEAEKNALDPLKWKTRREALQKKIDVERANIQAVDSKVAEGKEVSSGNLNSIVMYNTLLRVIAMVVNALLAHTLIRRFKD
jgi:hypothetical protein